MKALRRSFIFSGILLLFIVASSVMAAPRLTLPETSFNFGYVPQHAKISHSFMLQSTGDDTLKIVKVVPG